MSLSKKDARAIQDMLQKECSGPDWRDRSEAEAMVHLLGRMEMHPKKVGPDKWTARCPSCVKKGDFRRTLVIHDTGRTVRDALEDLL